MKNIFIFTITAVFLFGCVTARPVQQAGLPPYKPQSPALHDTIARLDSLFFDAYNNCKVDVMASLFSDSIEFYHDRGGLSTSKPGLMEALKANICGKVTRELLPGSIEVCPIPGYGAVQMGAHRFFNNQEAAAGWSRFSKFVHTWQNKNGQWQLTRVISLH